MAEQDLLVLEEVSSDPDTSRVTRREVAAIAAKALLKVLPPWLVAIGYYVHL